MSNFLPLRGARLHASRPTLAVFTALLVVFVAMIAHAQPPSPPAQAGPVIYSISPDRGAAGEQLAITGRGFAASNTVRVGEKSIADVPIATVAGINCMPGTSNCHPGINQVLRVTVPTDANLGSADVSVVNANGTSNAVPFTVLHAAGPR
jgi:hypothetical protein